MPKRGRAEAPKSKKAVSNTDDVWEEIDNTEETSGDFGFNKMNTNFYLNKGDKNVQIVFMDEAPVIFSGHTLTCRSSKGKQFYPTESCQKIAFDSCLMCSAKNKNVGNKRQVIAFRVLDSRGKYVPDKSDFDGVATVKIFLAPVYLAKAIKLLKDDAGDDFTKIVFNLSKDGKNYSINFKLEKGDDGRMDFVEAPDYLEEMPEIMSVYEPQEDEPLLDFLERFVDNFDGGDDYEEEEKSTPRRSDSSKKTSGTFGGKR